MLPSPGTGWRRHGGKMATVRQRLAGSLLSVGLVAVLGAVMLPLRSHLSVATTALVFVVPVVIGVAFGGFIPGVVAIVAGFVVYDVVFIPPYYTLSVGTAENWVALGVYVVVMLVVARVVAHLDVARSEAQRRATETRRIFDLSDVLAGESSVTELFQTIVTVVQNAFDVPAVALLVPAGERLAVVASVGDPPSPPELRRLSGSEVPMSLGTTAAAPDQMRAVAFDRVGTSGRDPGIAGHAGVLFRTRAAAGLRQSRRGGTRAGAATRAGGAHGVARGGRPSATRFGGGGVT